jgi:hypothetical protein
MSRLVLLITYADLVRTGPASLGFSGDNVVPVPLEVDASFVIEWTGTWPGLIGTDAVLSASFNYGELAPGLAELTRFQLGLGASGEIENLAYDFSPADTRSSTGIRITSDASHVVISGRDRTTGESFAYHYSSVRQTASRVPEFTLQAL